MRDHRSFWGFLLVGFLAMAAGIVMFVSVVPKKDDGGPPREMTMIFVNAYSQQNLLFSERGRYSPALTELGIDQEMCRRYSCLLQLHPSGKDYELRLSQGERSWHIFSKSPVPKEMGAVNETK